MTWQGKVLVLSAFILVVKPRLARVGGHVDAPLNINKGETA